MDVVACRGLRSCSLHDRSAHVGIREICCCYERFSTVATVCDDGSDRVQRPVGDAVRAEIVQKQHVRFQGRLISLAIARSHLFVVTGPNLLQKILIVEENAFVSSRD